jgi:hypothetical protein
MSQTPTDEKAVLEDSDSGSVEFGNLETAEALRVHVILMQFYIFKF